LVLSTFVDSENWPNELENSLRWPMHIVNSIDKITLSCYTPTEEVPQFLQKSTPSILSGLVLLGVCSFYFNIHVNAEWCFRPHHLIVLWSISVDHFDACQSKKTRKRPQAQKTLSSFFAKKAKEADSQADDDSDVDISDLMSDDVEEIVVMEEKED